MEKKMGMKRQKKMSSTLLNLSRSVQELTEENQSLKEDLDRMLSNSPTVSKIKGTFLQALSEGNTGKEVMSHSTREGTRGTARAVHALCFLQPQRP